MVTVIVWLYTVVMWLCRGSESGIVTNLDLLPVSGFELGGELADDSLASLRVGSLECAHDEYGKMHRQFENRLTLKVLVTTIDAQWEGMGDVGSARYEPALLPP